MAVSDRDERELREAVGLHQSGNLAAAINAYRKILKRSPKNAIANNLQGLAEFQSGHFEAAADALTKAFSLNPRIPDLPYNLATVLQRLGRFEQSVPHFEQALAAKPNDADARNNFGAALKSLGRVEDALREIRQALSLNPNHAGAHLNLGNVLCAQGEAAEGIAHIEKSIALQPRNPEAYVSLGNALVVQKRESEAIPYFEKAIALNPNLPEPYFFQGQALNKAARHDEAAGHFLKATQLKPDFAEAYVELGNSLQEMSKHEEAVPYYEKAILLKPDYPEALCNLGNAFQFVNRQKDSIELFHKALSLKPDFAEAIAGLGYTYYLLEDYKQSLELFEKALALAPGKAKIHINFASLLAGMDRDDEALAHLQTALKLDPSDNATKSWNMGFFLLGLGHWKQGWELHEYRFRNTSKPINYRDYPAPRWNGEKLPGTLLAWGEQGLGDQIIWAGLLPEVRQRVGKLIVECEPRLVPLFARSFADTEVVALDDDKLFAGRVDAHTPFASLAKFLRPDWESFPKLKHGYLRADEERAKKLRGKIVQGARAAIGVSWRSVNPFFGQAKTAQLRDFESVFRIPNCNFIDLQYGDTRAERELVASELGVTVAKLDEIDNTNDIDGLAALISACDAVVTTSNTTAHLAGALGKDTWVVLPHGRGRLWYWMKERTDSPWYSKVHLVRQAAGEPWSSVAIRAASELEAFLSQR